MSVYKLLVNNQTQEFILFSGFENVKYPTGWKRKETEIVTDAAAEDKFMDIQAEYEERRWGKC